MRIQLSENFYLDEFTLSQIAARNGIEIIVEEDSQAFRNLKYHCEFLLQPLRDDVGPLHISSGIRPVLVNELTGGSDHSGHICGHCSDIISYTHTPMQLCQRVKELDLPFDQLILEYWQWAHLGSFSYAREQRRQDMTAYKVKDKKSGKLKTKYIHGLHEKEVCPDVWI